MVDWRKLKKIDAHIHILPDAVHEANPDADDVWVHADLTQYLAKMEAFHIEKAVIMPFNDPWLMSMEFTIDAVHRNLAALKQQYPGRFFAFADVDPRNAPEESVKALGRAIDRCGLDGIKLHPTNTGISADDECNQAIYAFAQQRDLPVAIHSYPHTADDPDAAARILRVLEQYPKLRVIVTHMGAFQWEALLPTRAYVDFSAILPHFLRSYGFAKTEDILHRFGADRLIFATDYPDSRILQPGEIYPSYLDALSRMDFTRQEAEKIAYGNIEKLLHR